MNRTAVTAFCLAASACQGGKVDGGGDPPEEAQADGGSTDTAVARDIVPTADRAAGEATSPRDSGSAADALPAGSIGNLTVTFLKAHDGTFIRTPTGKLYQYEAGGDSTYPRIRAWLTANRITTLDGFIISHPHADHFGGVNISPTEGLFREFKVLGLWDGGQTDVTYWPGYKRTVVDLAASMGMPRTVVKEGMKMDLDSKLTVEVLLPTANGFTRAECADANGYDTDDNFTNENSMVVRIQHGKVVFLLTGDIHKLGMDYLLKNHPEKVKAHVLLVPHHGENRTYAPFKNGTKYLAAIAQYDNLYLSQGDPARNARTWESLYTWETASGDFYHPYGNSNPTAADMMFPEDGPVTVTSNGTSFTVKGETSGRTKTYNIP